MRSPMLSIPANFSIFFRRMGRSLRLPAPFAVTMVAFALASTGCQQPAIVQQAMLTQQPEPIPPPATPVAPLAPEALNSPPTDSPQSIPLTLPAQPEPPPN